MLILQLLDLLVGVDLLEIGLVKRLLKTLEIHVSYTLARLSSGRSLLVSHYFSLRIEQLALLVSLLRNC